MGMVFQLYTYSDQNPAEMQDAPAQPREDFFAADPPPGVEPVERRLAGRHPVAYGPHGWTCDYTEDGLDTLLDRQTNNSLQRLVGYREGVEWYSPDWGELAAGVQELRQALAREVESCEGLDVRRIDAAGATLVQDSWHALVQYEKDRLQFNEKRGTTRGCVYFDGLDTRGVLLGLDEGVPVVYLVYLRENWSAYLAALDYIAELCEGLGEHHVLRVLDVGLP